MATTCAVVKTATCALVRALISAVVVTAMSAGAKALISVRDLLEIPVIADAIGTPNSSGDIPDRVFGSTAVGQTLEFFLII
ncbi:hypothetical protein [Limnohabitans sp.]|uniref:hypothetical protein n=1 Tax=Limnohabitans sp. TaxID=1907725 RepID=UPI0038BBD452